eukprot:scaffold2552_cov380-Prasinococcus_capsulatus_cf.AAC.6
MQEERLADALTFHEHPDPLRSLADCLSPGFLAVASTTATPQSAGYCSTNASAICACHALAISRTQGTRRPGSGPYHAGHIQAGAQLVASHGLSSAQIADMFISHARKQLVELPLKVLGHDNKRSLLALRHNLAAGKRRQFQRQQSPCSHAKYIPRKSSEDPCGSSPPLRAAHGQCAGTRTLYAPTPSGRYVFPALTTALRCLAGGVSSPSPATVVWTLVCRERGKVASHMSLLGQGALTHASPSTPLPKGAPIASLMPPPGRFVL